MSVLTNKKEWTRFLKFGVVGLIGSVIDFGVMNLLNVVFKVPFLIASIVSFTLAVINNFILNRFWTYPETRENSFVKQLAQFAIVSCLGLAIRVPLLSYLDKVLTSLAAKWIPNFLTPTVVGHNVALAVVIGVVMIWNFIINRIWTFRNVPA
jgi:putative flippase GtrA